jgi:hypothetical protein
VSRIFCTRAKRSLCLKSIRVYPPKQRAKA